MGHSEDELEQLGSERIVHQKISEFLCNPNASPKLFPFLSFFTAHPHRSAYLLNYLYPFANHHPFIQRLFTSLLHPQ